jgi:hypothetical protein
VIVVDQAFVSIGEKYAMDELIVSMEVLMKHYVLIWK